MHKLAIKYFLLISAILLSCLCFAQRPFSVEFDSESIYIGKLKPGSEVVEVNFIFINKGNEAIIISNVETDGMCSLNSHTRGKVQAGSRGFINVSFKPGKSSGRFSESLKVIFNNTFSYPVDLNINGEILPRDKTMTDKFPYSSGPFNFEINILDAGQFLEPESVKASFPFYYDGRLPVSVNCVYPMEYMDVYVSPEIIHPGSTAKFHLQYFGKRMNTYGPLIDTLRICTNLDTVCFPFPAMADMREDFSKLKPDQIRVAPRISFESTNQDFGSVAVGEEATLVFEVHNKGQRQLVIRRLVPESPELSVSMDVSKVRLNKVGKITVKYRPRKTSQKVFEKILILSNDPRNPEINIYIQGVVK